MLELDLGMGAFLVVMGFLAAFIDSVVGGGGLISTPALMWTGLPLVTVLGTNKVAATMGALTSVVAFLRSGRVDVPLVKKLCPLSFVGSVAGVLTVRAVPPDFLRPLVVILLVAVAIYSAMKKDWGDVSTYHGMTARVTYLSFGVAFLFGFYDGFFGPGTGSFLLFSFLLLGFDFVGAAANARALNFSSNIAGLITFALLGAVEYRYALPMGLSMIVGAFCGTKMALTKGAGYVRPLFIVVTAILIGKQIMDLLEKS
ncbi:MAG: TSUP family transporter [Schwartzia sp. (in: firmicutes)]